MIVLGSLTIKVQMVLQIMEAGVLVSKDQNLLVCLLRLHAQLDYLHDHCSHLASRQLASRLFLQRVQQLVLVAAHLVVLL